MGSQTNEQFSGLVPLWIDGKEIATSLTFDIHSPNDGQKIWSSSTATVKEATQAVEAAQNACKSWRKVKATQRRAIFEKAATIMESRKEELIGHMMSETGALRQFAIFNIDGTVDALRECAGQTTDIAGSIPQTKTEGQAALVFKEPYGVILAIAPWNAPYALGVRSILFPMATGNTVVCKGAEACPRTYWAIASVFKEAGLPDGVLNMLVHRREDAAEVTNYLVDHTAIRKINFTGSPGVGSLISARAGKMLKPCLMELGGKSSAIVCEDADISKAAFQVAMGAFLNAGQICMSTERILVNRKIVDEFAEALSQAAEKIYAPDADAPVLVGKDAVQRIHGLLQDAVGKGANVVHGDYQAHDAEHYRLRPIIVSDVKKEMDIFYTESFGPTVSLITVDSDEEAIDIANDTEFGLSGAVFTESLGRGLKIAKEIDTGAVHINSMTVHDEAKLPHGGVKSSGWGRFNGKWGMDEFMKLKTVTYMEE